MKVGILGAGAIARIHAPNWVALGATVRVHSLWGANELASEYGLVVEEDRNALIGWADVVDICTPTTTHVELALAAIAAGRDLLCEKPLARTAAEARAIASAALHASVRVYPAHVVRYFPEYAALHAAVMDGSIGDLIELRFARGGAGPASDWFYSSAASGGLVMDLLIHDLDQARWIAGAVTQIQAVQDPTSESGILPRQVSADVALTHASGARSLIRGVWGPPGMEFGTSFEVVGRSGTLRNSSTGRPDKRPYLEELREFAAAFGGGPQPRVSLDDGVVAVALAEAAGESIASGRTMPFDEAAVLAGN